MKSFVVHCTLYIVHCTLYTPRFESHPRIYIYIYNQMFNRDHSYSVEHAFKSCPPSFIHTSLAHSLPQYAPPPSTRHPHQCLPPITLRSDYPPHPYPQISPSHHFNLPPTIPVNLRRLAVNNSWFIEINKLAVKFASSHSSIGNIVRRTIQCTTYSTMYVYKYCNIQYTTYNVSVRSTIYAV